MQHQDWEPVVFRKTAPRAPRIGGGGGNPKLPPKHVRDVLSDDPKLRYFDRDLVKRVVEARLAKGWNRKQLAAQLAVGVDVVDRLETNRLVYSPAVKSKLSRVLGVS